MFKFFAAYSLICLIVEVILFSVWLYLDCKPELASKYWLNNYNTKNIVDLSYRQTCLLRLISFTKWLTITFLIIHVIVLASKLV